MTASIYEGKSKVRSSDKEISSLFDDDKQALHTDYSNDNSQTDNNIKSLDIADGLKDLLVLHGFTIDLLLSISATQLSNTLGIDEYVAKIICQSANRLVSDID